MKTTSNPCAYPAWLPPPHAVRSEPAGRHWDAILTCAALGERAVAILGAQAGPVINDELGQRYFVLVPTCVADQWDEPNTQAWGAGTVVPVPGLEASCGQLWRVPPDGSRLTDPDALRIALKAAADTSPDKETAR